MCVCVQKTAAGPGKHVAKQANGQGAIKKSAKAGQAGGFSDHNASWLRPVTKAEQKPPSNLPAKGQQKGAQPVLQHKQSLLASGKRKQPEKKSEEWDEEEDEEEDEQEGTSNVFVGVCLAAHPWVGQACADIIGISESVADNRK